MAEGHQLGLRLFLEGVEVPVIGASVQVVPNAPTAASIQVIATDRVLELLPRTVVHLFFYDFVDVMNPTTETQVNPYNSTEDDINERYKLLFMGEVQGIAFQKDAGSRAVILNCVDFSNYWDTTYQYNFQGSLLGGRRHAYFIGANTNLLNSPLGHGVGTFAALLSARSVNFPNLKGLLAGIVRILEAIGGSYYGDTTFRGANDFTAIAELRLKILQQISAAEKDNSTARLFRRKAFNMWMNRQMGGLGKLVTFRGIIQVLQKFIFHEIWPNPVPRYQPKVTGLKKTKVYRVDLEKDPRTRKVVAEAKKMRSLFQSAKDNLHNYRNVTSGSAKEQYGKAASADLFQAYKSLNRATVSTVRVSQIDRYMNTISGSFAKIRGAIGWPGSGFYLDTGKLQYTTNLEKANNAINEALSAIEALLNTKMRRSKEITYDKLDRVHNQVLRPDIWFASPPRCNILFPELYGNFSWQRNYFREVSRIELQTTNEILGDSALFNGRYYAPDVKDMRKGVRLSSRRFGRLIMEHELYTGIIPMFEKMSQANIYAMKSRQQNKKGAKVKYAQRAVNHQYFKHRYAARGMSASGRFNPWFVPGFPTLLLDRPMTSDNLVISGLPIAWQLQALNITPKKGVDITRGTLLQLLVPTQFLGNCIQLAHQVNQQGGGTTYAFGQARLHRETTELLGVDKVTLSKKIGTVKRKTVVAVIDSNDATMRTATPKKGGRGPRGGVISAVTDVTNAKKGRFRTVYNQTGTAQIGFSGGGISVKGYEVSEVVDRRVKVKIREPMEEAVRPGWIWDGWSNLKIGQTYMQLFGTNALTDIEGITSDDLKYDMIGFEVREGLLETEEGKAHGISKKEAAQQGTYQNRKYGTGQKKALGDDRTNKASAAAASTPAATSQKVSASSILTMEKERTIENAVDYLVRVYSFLMHNGLDINEFVRNYTWRPAATLPEILGYSDFNITEEIVGSGKYVTEGTEGFHSRAFGDISDLFGLIDPKVKKVLGLSEEKSHATAKKLDVRGRRRSVVREYVDELTQSKGLLG